MGSKAEAQAKKAEEERKKAEADAERARQEREKAEQERKIEEERRKIEELKKLKKELKIKEAIRRQKQEEERRRKEEEKRRERERREREERERRIKEEKLNAINRFRSNQNIADFLILIERFSNDLIYLIKTLEALNEYKVISNYKDFKGTSDGKIQIIKEAIFGDEQLSSNCRRKLVII